MPKSHLDWLGVVSLWFGAGVMAVKAAGLQLIAGAPPWFAAEWWNYIPLPLITFYLAIALYRQFRPVGETRTVVETGAKAVPAAKPSAQREHERILVALDAALRNSGYAIADAPAAGLRRVAERELPGIRAALLSAHKLHDTPMFGRAKDPALELEIHRRVIERMLPFLKEGHIEEARQEAQKFLDDIDPTQVEPT